MNTMDYIISQITSSEVNAIGAFFKLGLSLILGAVIGIERRRKGQFAGTRTFALISMGATLAMLVSIYVPQEYMGLKNGDPGRIAAQERLCPWVDHSCWYMDCSLYWFSYWCRYVHHCNNLMFTDFLYSNSDGLLRAQILEWRRIQSNTR